jgi:hypothetical protein
MLPDRKWFEGEMHHFSDSFTLSTQGQEHSAIEFEASALLDEKVAEAPIQTGAEKRGVLPFIFRDLTREKISQKGTEFLLGFQDVKGVFYFASYKFYGPRYESFKYEPGMGARIVDKKGVKKSFEVRPR